MNGRRIYIETAVSWVLFLLVMQFAHASYAFAAYESEPNDDLASATKLSDGVGCGGRLSSKTDEDWFEFELDRNSKVEYVFDNDLYSNGLTSSFWSISVLDAYSNILQANGLGPNHDLTNFIGLKPGRYYLHIKKGANYSSTATYRLTITIDSLSNVELEPNDEQSNATEIFDGIGCQGKLASKGDVDWFVFSVDQNSKVKYLFGNGVQSNGLTSSFWTISIYDSFGNALQTYALGPNKDLSGFIGLKTGLHFIEIKKGANYSSNSTYVIKVDLDPGANVELEPNEDADHSTLIYRGRSYEGKLSSKNDKDWYRFSLSKRTTLGYLFYHEPMSTGLSSSRWILRIYTAGLQELKAMGIGPYYPVSGSIDLNG